LGHAARAASMLTAAIVARRRRATHRERRVEYR
jgi:hypothetical protein